MELLAQLKKYPVFDLNAVARKTGATTEYIKLILHRLKEKKLVLPIEKNKYTLHRDPWIVASHLLWPAYISGWAALRYYSVTEQLPNTIEVITTRKRKKRVLRFQGTTIQFIATKPALFFGFRKLLREEAEIFVAEPEKALLDAAFFKQMSFSEIMAILEGNRGKFHKEKLLRYLLRMKNKSLIKRFGYVLDSLGKDYFGKLHRYMDQNYVALDYSLPAAGGKNKKWRIIENVTKRRINKNR